jgi:hypothetical protein
MEDRSHNEVKEANSDEQGDGARRKEDSPSWRLLS